MRPHPQHDHGPAEGGRIIRLGDVRRRRAARKRAPDRQYLAALLLVALVCWALWLTVLFTVPPARLLTYLAFFAPMALALAATGALAAYGIEWRRGFAPSLVACARRGALGSGVIVLNLAVLAGHRWSLPAGLALLAAAVGLDLVASRALFPSSR